MGAQTPPSSGEHFFQVRRTPSTTHHPRISRHPLCSRDYSLHSLSTRTPALQGWRVWGDPNSRPS